jgi:hypothetical protein
MQTDKEKFSKLEIVMRINSYNISSEIYEYNNGVLQFSGNYIIITVANDDSTVEHPITINKIYNLSEIFKYKLHK